MKCDISKYFPNINHKILMSLLEKANFSSDEIWFLNLILKGHPSYVVKGVPLGNQSSQWFALYYLNTTDRLVKEKLRIKYYLRYMDDFILIHNDKEYLKKCLKEIEYACNTQLDLKLNNKTQIGMVRDGIDFLGFNHSINEKGKVIVKIRSSAKRRMKKHLKALKKLRNKGRVDDEYVFLRKNAFLSHLNYSNKNSVLKDKIKSDIFTV